RWHPICRPLPNHIDLGVVELLREKSIPHLSTCNHAGQFTPARRSQFEPEIAVGSLWTEQGAIKAARFTDRASQIPPLRRRPKGRERRLRMKAWRVRGPV